MRRRGNLKKKKKKMMMMMMMMREKEQLNLHTKTRERVCDNEISNLYLSACELSNWLHNLHLYLLLLHFYLFDCSHTQTLTHMSTDSREMAISHSHRWPLDAFHIHLLFFPSTTTSCITDTFSYPLSLPHLQFVAS